MRNATLCFLIKKRNKQIEKLCLALKKRGFGAGRWNGVGGKFDRTLDRSIKDTAKREASEEIKVTVGQLIKVAKLKFRFPHKPEWNQTVHAYFASDWEGHPKETEEMKPRWWAVERIPYKKMWPDDLFWLPEVINHKYVEAVFTFGQKDIITSKQVRVLKRNEHQ